MTSLQTDRIKEFENEVRKRGGSAVMDWKESISPESRINKHTRRLLLSSAQISDSHNRSGLSEGTVDKAKGTG